MGDVALVVGGSGFIGRHLCRELVRRGHEVVAVSRKAPKIVGVRHIALDVTDRQEVLDKLRPWSPRWVFNLAGRIDHTCVWPNQREVIAQHFCGVINLVEALSVKSVDAFVSVGSADEYGSQPGPLTESMREQPIAPYSVAKVASSHYLQMMAHQSKFPASIARLFLVYGPEQDDRRLIPQVCKGLLSGKSVEVTSGLQRRDFLFVGDAVSGLIAIASCRSARGMVVNVASGQPTSIRSVLESLRELVGRGELLFGARPTRQGEPDESVASTARLNELGIWKPKWSLTEGLAETVKYYCSVSND